MAACRTVRTLHHYDDIGLLTPDRTPAGHRVYRREQVERLYRISVLRRFGTPLDYIARALDDPTWTLDGALRTHLATLEDQVLRMERVLHRLGDVPADGPADEDVCRRLLAVLEDTAVTATEPLRRIAVLVYADLEAAHRHLVDVFGWSRGRCVATTPARSCTPRSAPPTGSSCSTASRRSGGSRRRPPWARRPACSSSPSRTSTPTTRPSSRAAAP